MLTEGVDNTSLSGVHKLKKREKRKMKKLLFVTLLLCLTLCLGLVSCGGSETGDSSGGVQNDVPSGSTNLDSSTTDSREPAHEHSYGEWLTTKEPTCTENGERKQTCSCNDFKTEIITATGHTEKTVFGKAPTCTEAGLTDGKKCSVCGETTLAQKTILANGHKEITIVGKEATCTETGLTDGKNARFVKQSQLNKQ